VLVFDSPPALSVADGLVLAGRADAALIVVAAGSTQVAAVRRLRVLLAQSGTRLLGTVLNRAQTGWERYEPAIPAPVSSTEEEATDPLLRGA
jgi:Mrp family chromosome partitioning ATPase